MLGSSCGRRPPLHPAHVLGTCAGHAATHATPVPALPSPLPYITGLNKYSARITQPKSQGASQAMLYATGLTETDMDKPQVRRGCRAAPGHLPAS